MASADTTTNQSQISQQKSDVNKPKHQNQPESGTDDPNQINGKTVVGTFTF